MTKKIVIAVAMALAAVAANAQTTKTVSYAMNVGRCTAPAVTRYSCAGYMTSPNSPTPMYEEEWSLYIPNVQSDGSFTGGGFLNLYAAFDDEDVQLAEDVTSFQASSVAGTVNNGFINGTASGTLSGKHTGTFTAALVNLKIGTAKLCAGKYGCHNVPAIVSGSIHVTAQVTQ